MSSLCSLSGSKCNLPHCLWPLTSGFPVWIKLYELASLAVWIKMQLTKLPLAFDLRLPSVDQCIWACFAHYLDKNATYHTAFSLWPQAFQCGSTYVSSLRSLSESKCNLPHCLRPQVSRCGLYAHFARYITDINIQLFAWNGHPLWALLWRVLEVLNNFYSCIFLVRGLFLSQMVIFTTWA